MKKIAVVILNWNGIELLKKFIPNTINNSKQANIYVIDNFSEDDSVDFLKRNYSNIKVIELDKNYGFAEGYNLGLKEIDEEIYCLINSDIKVTKNWLEPVINKFNNNNVSIAQPIILDYNKEDHYEYAGAAGGFIDKFGYPFCRGRIINSIEKNLNQYKDSKIFWATGACLFVKRRVFNKLNGFDKDFFAHQEEIDFCWRAFNLNYNCHAITSSKVFHIGAYTIKDSPQKTYLNYRNSLFMLVKNLPYNKLWTILPQRIIIDIISSFYFILNFRFMSFLSVYRAYLSLILKFYIMFNKRGDSLKKDEYFYIKSIIFDYFILKKRKFFKLKYNKLP